MTTAFVYHANCLDGFGAAWAAYKHNYKPDNIFYPMSYGQKLPDHIAECDRIFFLDFCLSRQEIIDLRAQGKKVVVIDHHASAKDALDGLDDCVFDMDHSGAVLTWKYFQEGSNVIPTILRYIEDGDLYKFALPNSKEILAVIHNFVPKTFNDFNAFQNQLVGSGYYINGIIEKGKNIIEINKKYVSSTKKLAILMPFAGYNNVPVVNTHYYQVSDILHELAVESEHGFAVSWFQQPDGIFKYSLRSVSESAMNVAKLAEKLKIEHDLISGAGHPCASGMLAKTPFHLGY